MDPHAIHQLTTARHDDLVRDADEARIARRARDTRDQDRPAPRPSPRASGARRLRVAG